MHEIKIYTRENKSSKTCEYQPDKLDDHLIENTHEECSPHPPPPPPHKKKKKKGKKKIFRKNNKLSQSKMNPSILLYHMPNKLLSPEKFANRVLFYFFSSVMKNNCHQMVRHYIETNCENKESRML